MKSTAVDFGSKKCHTIHIAESCRTLLVQDMLIQVDLDFLKLVKEDCVNANHWHRFQTRMQVLPMLTPPSVNI